MNYKGYKLVIVRDPKSSKHYTDSNGMVRNKLQDVLRCEIYLEGKSLGYEYTVKDAKLRIDC